MLCQQCRYGNASKTCKGESFSLGISYLLVIIYKLNISRKNQIGSYRLGDEGEFRLDYQKGAAVKRKNGFEADKPFGITFTEISGSSLWQLTIRFKIKPVI